MSTKTHHVEPDDVITQFGFHRIVAANIRAEVARQQITQDQIADALGITQQVVSNRLRGKTPFTINEVFRVARLLGVKLGDLLASDRDTRPTPDGPDDGVEVGPGAMSDGEITAR